MPFVRQVPTLPRRPKTLAVALAAVCLLAATAPARAGQPDAANGKALKEACLDDYKTLCAGVQPGGGRILACLKQQADKLSPGCKQALTAAQTAKQASGAAQ
jgi:hypothetical protein